MAVSDESRVRKMRVPFRRSGFPGTQALCLMLVASSTVLAVSCGKPPRQTEQRILTRDLTKAEAIEDLNELVSKVSGLYGLLPYKENRFGYKLEDLVAKARQRIESSKNDIETYAAMRELIASFEDGHSNLKFSNVSGEAPLSWYVPLMVMPVEGRVLVTAVGAALAASGLSLGDEILLVDGVKPFELLPSILRYEALGNAESDKHMIMRIFNRPVYIPEIMPSADAVKVQFKNASGVTKDVELKWNKLATIPSPRDLANEKTNPAAMRSKWFEASNARALDSVPELDLRLMGNPVSFFHSTQSQAAFAMEIVKPSKSRTDQFVEGEPAKIHAVKYKFEGKTILVVRQPDYSVEKPKNYIQTYRALLSEFEPQVDVVVIDQTHNPGGSLDYCEAFFRLFANSKARTLVQSMHADRKWINDIKDWAKELDPKLESEVAKRVLSIGSKIEEAYDANFAMTKDFFPLSNLVTNLVDPDEVYTWKKPVLVLTDELAGSCGDIFPMLMQRNKIAKLFGNRTMGLGGNVESLGKLSHSQAELRLARGLFATYREDGKYGQEDVVENVGVTPDYPFLHTVDDVRGGYVKYVEAFSRKALEQIPSGTPAAKAAGTSVP
jgi:C-terminal processing protease CtpA/Prc